MMKINEIWNELESDGSLSVGLLLRRYSTTIVPDIYVALRQPEKLRCIALRLQNDIEINLSRYSNLKDISLELLPDEKDNLRCYLLIILLSQQHRDVFATLCEDLINGIGNADHHDKVVKELLNRLEKWKSLFDRADMEGLSQEEQRGLYGELYFLRKWIIQNNNHQKSINSWCGPQKNIRDFQLQNWAVEVKTTYGNNHQRVHISNERQLDTTNLSTLLLFHISLEVQKQNGENLNQIVDSILQLLNHDVSAQTEFKSKLLQIGYFDHHTILYSGTGYHIRGESFYSVRDDFPRIEEADIRKGVGDVKYSIILSEYASFIIKETEAFEIIN